MTIGEYIRQLRTEHHMTQEELGQKLDPPVNRAAVQKWESGHVTNIRISYIEQMADIFGVSPSSLMCFDAEQQVSGEVKAIELVQKYFGSGAVYLLESYTNLNVSGKSRLIEMAEDFCELPKYSDS